MFVQRGVNAAAMLNEQKATNAIETRTKSKSDAKESMVEGLD